MMTRNSEMAERRAEETLIRIVIMIFLVAATAFVISLLYSFKRDEDFNQVYNRLEALAFSNGLEKEIIKNLEGSKYLICYHKGANEFEIVKEFNFKNSLVLNLKNLKWYSIKDCYRPIKETKEKKLYYS